MLERLATRPEENGDLLTPGDWRDRRVADKPGYGNLSSVEDTPLSEFRAQIETNLFGTIIVTKAALRYFREKKAGQFIQFSSVGGRIGPAGRGPYSAAK